ncbi:MAG: phosphotransferase [Akkermansiaceae bacterium]
MSDNARDRLAAALSAWGRKCDAVSHSDGGANSRIFLLSDETGACFCAKVHQQDAEGPRYMREKKFYAAAKQAVRGRIPEDLHWDDERATAFFEFVEGTMGFDPSEQDVLQAGEFILRLQKADREELWPASEAAMEPEDHARILEQRLLSLASLSDGEVASFVREHLSPAYEQLLPRIRPNRAAPIVSPSDFGFHNVLRRADGRLCVFDFEHAGMDDPAKLVCDFFVRPDSGVRIDWLDGFCQAAGFGHDVKERALGLMDLYRLKWACIALNEFTPEGCRRRGFAEADAPGRREAQLEKARRLVREVTGK